jgi:photosystem II stability/assembly factor-like uncharacterized protein
LHRISERAGMIDRRRVAVSVGAALAAPSLVGLSACAGAAIAPEAKPAAASLGAHDIWQKLDTVASRGKQDDIFFLTPQLGWYVNGEGKIHKTTDGGVRWVEVFSKPGTYFRTIAFVDDKHGFAGNIGTDYFPGVVDTTPLYVTHDGGATWSPVQGITGPTVKGLCALDVVHTEFIDAGVLQRRVVVHAGGRVGGPAFLMRSLDGGSTWRSMDLSAHTKMILDVQFHNENVGFVMGASDDDVQRSNALVLRTRDGGATWQRVFQSTRPYEITWKASFPTRDVGYATIQSYDPDKSVSRRHVAKTTDGGTTWRELSLVDRHEVREFGIAFVDERTGWVGTSNGGYRTDDGGATWRHVEMGRAVNRIRVVRAPGSNLPVAAYAIGVDVRRSIL